MSRHRKLSLSLVDFSRYELFQGKFPYTFALMVREKQRGGGEDLLSGVDKPILRGMWFPSSR